MTFRQKRKGYLPRRIAFAAGIVYNGYQLGKNGAAGAPLGAARALPRFGWMRLPAAWDSLLYQPRTARLLGGMNVSWERSSVFPIRRAASGKRRR